MRRERGEKEEDQDDEISTYLYTVDDEVMAPCHDGGGMYLARSIGSVDRSPVLFIVRRRLKEGRIHLPACFLYIGLDKEVCTKTNHTNPNCNSLMYTRE